MGDFAKRQAAQIKYAEEQREKTMKQANTESQAFVERENLKRRLGPDLWLSFRELVVAKCQAVNKELGKEHYRWHDELPNKLRVIRLNPIANLRLEFFPDGGRIHYDSGECVGDYLIGLDESSGQATLSDAYQRIFEPELTAEHLLENCLEKAHF